mmetsp:Transcript_32542/g.89770  ORF Transcript_32542/g.89770 Transcript_32542/m.89770 type:complete len:253 (-) Transcript_32542:2305-3063(-)
MPLSRARELLQAPCREHHMHPGDSVHHHQALLRHPVAEPRHPDELLLARLHHRRRPHPLHLRAPGVACPRVADTPALLAPCGHYCPEQPAVHSRSRHTAGNGVLCPDAGHSGLDLLLRLPVGDGHAQGLCRPGLHLAFQAPAHAYPQGHVPREGGGPCPRADPQRRCQRTRRPADEPRPARGQGHRDDHLLRLHGLRQAPGGPAAPSAGAAPGPHLDGLRPGLRVPQRREDRDRGQDLHGSGYARRRDQCNT